MFPKIRVKSIGLEFKKIVKEIGLYWGNMYVV